MAFLGLTYRGILTSGVNLGFGGITRRRSSYTPEAIAYFSAVAAVGGTLTDGEKNLYNQLFLNLKGLGTVGSSDIFSKLDVLQVYHAPNESAAKIDLKSLSNILFTNTYTFTPYEGFKGDGSTGYINTTYNPTTYNANYKQNDAFYLIASKSVVNGRYIGGARRTGSDQSYLRAGNTGVAQEAKINDSSGALNYGTYSGQYYNAVDRASSTGARAYRDGLLVDTNTAVSGARLNAIMIIPGFNNFPTTDDGIVPAVLNSTDYYNFFTAGASLTDSEHYQLYSALNKFKNDTITYNATQAYFSAVTASGGTLTDNVQAEFTSFVSREVEAGRWSKIKRLYPFLGGKIASAVIDAVTTNTATNSNFIDTDVDATVGLQGDGTTKYLTDYQVWSNIISSQYKVTIGNFYGSGLNQENSNPYIYGSISGGNYIATRILSTSTIARSYVGLSSPFSQVARTLLSNESVIATRLSNVYSATLVSGSTDLVDTSTTTYSMPANEPSYFKANGAGGISQGLSNGFFIAEFDTLQEVKDFETSYKTFINNITAYAAAQAYFNAVATAGGTLSSNVISEFTSFVSREVNAGRWSKLKRLYPFLGGTVNSAIIDAKTLNSAISVNFVDADADATIGLQGDGTSKYLDTDLRMNNIVSSNYDWQMGYFIIGNVPTLTSLVRPMGYYRSTGTRGAVYLQIDTSKRPSAFGNWSGISTGSSASLVNNSSHFGARFSNTELIVMQDGVKKNTNVTADADVLIDVPVTMFGFQINGVYQSFSPMNHSGYFIAEGMTEADLTAFDTSYKEFITNVQAYAALMDSYASAAAAYSLRKLYSSYEGSAINVRRSSDNATQDIGFDGYVLDTASLLSFVGAGSGYVTTWYDQSGNGVDATQSTASAQPTIVSSGSLITDGGKSAISFNGISNYMLFARQPFESSFVTGKFSKQVDYQRTLYTGGSDANSGFCQSSDLIWRNADPYNYQVGYNGSTDGARTLTPFNTKDIITVTPSSTNTYSNIRFNGVEVASTTSNAASGSTASNSIIGARANGLGGSAVQFLNAPLHEIILYNNTQESNQSAIESLINTYYGIY